ncbi:alpha/beta fold hydrolase, partial [Novosphingobium sp. 1949]
GWPVLRFDRRGVGDSDGENRSFRASAPDIAAALAALRAACPQVTRVVGLGNCDGAAALMLTHGYGLDALVLSNPWTIEDDESETVPSAATRAHYARRLADPAALRRLLSGRVALRPLLASLLSTLRRAEAGNALTGALKDGLAGFCGPVRLLIAGRDRTGQTFLARWDRNDPRIRLCPDATHSYVEPEARQWLFDQVTAALTDLS